MDWGLRLYDHMRELDIVPFIDRIKVSSGTDVSGNGMIIVPHNIADILDIHESKENWEVKINFLRDTNIDDLITIVPKFVGIDVDKKIVEVLFNA